MPYTKVVWQLKMMMVVLVMLSAWKMVKCLQQREQGRTVHMMKLEGGKGTDHIESFKIQRSNFYFM